jgi:predicted 3-demethylubiquinone-9 3-methyltransferase (glyoxalase superfamily)
MVERIPKTTVCLWFNHTAEEAANFYARTFPGSLIGTVHRAPGDYPNGKESQCGWCKDKWGLSWQITPVALTAAMSDPDPAVRKRVFSAMMGMKRIDVAAIAAARR